MTSEPVPGWSTATIGEIARVAGGGTPKTTVDDYWGDEVPWLTPKDLRNYGARYIERGERSITRRGLEESSTRLLPEGTVLVSSRAPIGYVAIAACPIATNQGFKSLVLKEGHHPEFYYYVMKTKTAEMEAVAGGSTFKEISGKVMKTIPVPVPPIEEQRAIANVLGALDDRIEWCDTVASSLLQLSRAAFQGWVAAVGDDEVGIYDVAEVEYGAPYKSALFNDDGVGLPVIRIRDVGAEDTTAYTTEKHQRDVVIEPGDIVVGMDGEFRAHPWRGPTALLNQRVCTFRPQLGVARTLVLHALEEPLRFYENSITGTTVIHLGKKHIDRFRVAYSREGNARLRAVADPMLDQIVELYREKRNLQQLRDTLLPRLLSGDLRIEDPSRLLGALS